MNKVTNQRNVVDEVIIHSLKEEDFSYKIKESRLAVRNLVIDTISYEPLDYVDNRSVVIVPWFGAPHTLYKSLARNMANKWEKVILYRSPRSWWIWYDSALDTQKNALEIVIAWDKKINNTKKFDIVWHSMWNIIALNTANRDTDIAENIDNILSDAWAWLVSLRNDPTLLNKALMVYFNSMAQSMTTFMNPNNMWLLSDMVMHAMSDYSTFIREMLETTKMRAMKDTIIDIKNKGKKVWALMPEYDWFFNPTDVISEEGDVLDWYKVIEWAYHLDPVTDWGTHSDEVIEWLTTLRKVKRRAKKQK